MSVASKKHRYCSSSPDADRINIGNIEGRCDELLDFFDARDRVETVFGSMKVDRRSGRFINPPVKTLKTMTEDEIVALEKQYTCKVRRPV
jgi:hypothetical protein